jgi:phage tail sheath protein FI
MQPLAVPSIDFLPAAYRQKSLQRRDRLWQIAIVACGLLLIGGAWIYRFTEKRGVKNDLDLLAQRYDKAVATNARWSKVLKTQSEADVQARLVVYLRRPWPTTRILSAVMPSLPETIQLTELKIVQEANGTPQPATAAPRRPNGGKPDLAEQQQPPAQRDLEKLQTEADAQRTVILLSGETTDPDALNRYIGQLHASDVVQRAELVSLASVSSAKATAETQRISQFQAKVLIRPSYCEVGGPTVPASTTELADALHAPPKTN